MDIFKKMRFKNVSPIKGIIRTRSDRCYRCIGRHIDFQNARNIIAGLFKVRVWIVLLLKAPARIESEINWMANDRLSVIFRCHQYMSSTALLEVIDSLNRRSNRPIYLRSVDIYMEKLN